MKMALLDSNNSELQEKVYFKDKFKWTEKDKLLYQVNTLVSEKY